MKILYVTTIGITMGFFKDFIRELLDAGHSVDIAANTNASPVPECYSEWGCRIFTIDCQRSPFSAGNVRSIGQLKKLVQRGQYDIVHCHTPIAAAAARIACRSARRQGTRVLYTAHGFHFYKGAPKKNWLIYYPVEWLCAHWTDTLITINQEDFALAKAKFAGRGGCRVEYVPGVGIDLERFGGAAEPTEKRRSLGIPEDKLWMLSVGELITRKNHETLIRAIADIPNIYLTIAGRGELQEYLTELIKELGLTERVRLLGFRTDISELCTAADVFCLPSFQEGLPVALMEAMACGKPCIASNIRGNTDLVTEENALFDPHSAGSIRNAVQWLLQSDLQQLGRRNAETIQNFSIDAIIDEMNEIYAENINGGGYTLIEKMYRRALLRKALGIPANAQVLLSVGELNENKNHETVIRALAELCKDGFVCGADAAAMPQSMLNAGEEQRLSVAASLETAASENSRAAQAPLYYLIAGEGAKRNALQALISELGLDGRIRLLGFRTDAAELYKAADLFVFPSFREGLSVSLMEAMASGLPCCVSQIRGNVDLIDSQGGAVFSPASPAAARVAIEQLLPDPALARSFGAHNKEKVQAFSRKAVSAQMRKLYGA